MENEVNLHAYLTSTDSAHIYAPTILPLRKELPVVLNISGIAQCYSAGLRAGWLVGSSPSKDWEFFFFTIASRPAMGPTQPPIHWVLSIRVKRPGRETDRSPPCSAEVKNAWRYTSTPQYAFMAWWSVKALGQLYLYVYLTGCEGATKMESKIGGQNYGGGVVPHRP
jgi:hypothetical protein